MSESEPFLLPLSYAQLQQMVQAVAGRQSGVGLLRVLLALTGGANVKLADVERDELFDAKEISTSVIVGLVVLAGFSDGEEHAVTELGVELGLNASTTLRYIRTWMAVGLLEQERKGRRYRLAAAWRQLASGEPDTPHDDAPQSS